MALTIRYFAWVRELVGRDDEWLDLPEGISTAGEVAQFLASRGDGYAQAFADPAKLRCAIDLEMAPLHTPIGSAHEIAFFPPVTGG